MANPVKIGGLFFLLPKRTRFNNMSYRTRVRTPSFAHLQQIPAAIRGSLVSDLIVYLGSIDFVMSDVDR